MGLDKFGGLGRRRVVDSRTTDSWTTDSRAIDSGQLTPDSRCSGVVLDGEDAATVEAEPTRLHSQQPTSNRQPHRKLASLTQRSHPHLPNRLPPNKDHADDGRPRSRNTAFARRDARISAITRSYPSINGSLESVVRESVDRESVVRGVSCPGSQLSGVNCPGVSCPGVSCPDTRVVRSLQGYAYESAVDVNGTCWDASIPDFLPLGDISLVQKMFKNGGNMIDNVPTLSACAKPESKIRRACFVFSCSRKSETGWRICFWSVALVRSSSTAAPSFGANTPPMVITHLFNGHLFSDSILTSICEKFGLGCHKSREREATLTPPFLRNPPPTPSPKRMLSYLLQDYATFSTTMGRL